MGTRGKVRKWLLVFFSRKVTCKLTGRMNDFIETKKGPEIREDPPPEVSYFAQDLV